MKDTPHTRGLRTHITFAIPTEWTAEQALAIVELLDDLREHIWQHYQLPLHELIREQHCATPTHDPSLLIDDPPF